MSWRALVDQLRGTTYQFGVIEPDTPTYRVEFDPGLTDAEVVRVHQWFGFRFPPDLRAFLQTALPRGPLFPDWRGGDPARLRDWLDRPRRGILFDVEYNDYWHPDWNARPCMIEDALSVASEGIKAAPRLIPVFAHRMMAAEPHRAGNPVFSVHQTDIICYGFDLADYLRHEFNLPGRAARPGTVRPIRFWSECAR
jgi:hypothetical protein